MRLLLAVTAAAALASVAVPGHAAPAPQIKDASGDAVVPVGGDIVSALFATTGKTVKVGAKSSYVPKVLTVTVTYTAAPDSSPLATQAVLFDIAGCGAVYLQRYSGGIYSSADCLEDQPGFDVLAKGSTLVFTMPFSSIGKQVKKGTALTNLRTLTGLADPVVGLGPSDVDEMLTSDLASTDATYRIA